MRELSEGRTDERVQLIREGVISWPLLQIPNGATGRGGTEGATGRQGDGHTTLAPAT